jgi:hypothetical protein
MDQPTPGDAGLGRTADDEIETLRERFALIEEIDSQTSEMFERMASLLRGSSEARAQASLEIATGLQRLSDRLAEDRERQRETMRALQADIESARLRMQEVVHAVASLGSHVSGLQARIAPATGDAAQTGPSEPAAAVSPLPAVQSWTVEIADVPSAAVALSLQRHLSALPHVMTATSRAFEAGTVSFALRTRRPLSGVDLSTWAEGDLEVLGSEPFAIRARVLRGARGEVAPADPPS